MAYEFNPSPSEQALLWLIRNRESGQNYQATNPASTASGAYQFINSTWAYVASLTGVGTQYPRAYLAPILDQDTNALLLLRMFGPNSTRSWKASGPYPKFNECRGMCNAAGLANA